MLIVLAKLGTAETVGQFALGLAVATPVLMFTNLQLSALQATDAARQYEFGHYLALRLLSTAAGLAVIAGLALGVGFSPAAAGAVLALGLAKGFEAISDAYHGLMQQHSRLDRVARSQLLKGPLSILALACGVWLSGSAVGGALALAAAWGLLLALYDARSPAWLRRTQDRGSREASSAQVGFSPLDPRSSILDPRSAVPRWDWNALGRLAWLALPLGFVTLLFTLGTNIPRYFVEHRLGERALGIFAALAYFAVVGQLLTNSLAQVAAPRMGAQYATGDLPSFRLLVLRLVGIGLALGGAGILVALVAGRLVLTLVYRPEYAEHAGAFTIIMAGSALWGVVVVLGYAATAARRGRSQTAAAATVVLAALVASAVLIHADTLEGAAIATVVSAAVGIVAFGAIFLTTRQGTAQRSMGAQ
jgi:O-antigen/teichoic acid export membrane protein